MNFKLLLKKFGIIKQFRYSTVKYSKQAYYNGNPEYYDLPTSQRTKLHTGLC
jgi:hypothetical protein